jgi:GT2 family glycosyltransferase
MQTALSIVIPVGRPERARATIQSIRDQFGCELCFEVICAGHNLADFPVNIPAARHVEVVCIEQRTNPALTRMRGIERACGAWLLMVDDDVMLENDFLIQVKRIIDDDQLIAVGAQLVSYPPTYWNRCIDLTNFPVQQGSRAGTRPWLYSAAWCIPRKLYDVSGGFDPKLDVGEDVDLCRRLVIAGAGLQYEPMLKAKHCHGRDDFKAATDYMIGNGRLAKQLEKNSTSPRRHKRGVVMHLIVILGTSLRYCAISCPAYLIYFPGILVLSLVLATSIGRNYSSNYRHRALKSELGSEETG